MASSLLPSRQIHLDFHTGPSIPDVGVDFNAKAFAKTMKDAHVDSVTLFAKCHHGHLYYDTKHPARHPGMKKNFDLLAGQVDALKSVGIRTPIYISVQCDEFAANTHPDWIAKNADGTTVGGRPLQTPYPNYNWQILDMNSPYQEYVAQQLAEVLKLFKPVDGLFFDMCWDQPSVTQWAIAAMKRKNLNPDVEADRVKHAHEVAIAYMKRFHKQVKESSKNAGVYFNSRPLHNLAEELPYLAQVEIEALPTGGWGYMYFPKNVRFARTFGREYLGMTARFHKSWADFGGLKPYAALEYETSQMMAHGAKCSVGDQLHPRGTLDTAAYDLIGKVYERAEARQPWLEGAKAQVQIGLFPVPRNDGSAWDQAATPGTDEGATRLLTHLKHQFDVVNAESKFDKYDLLVLPDAIHVDAPLAERLSAYIKAGGKILASGFSGLSADGKSLALPELGITPSGPCEFQTTYLRFGKEIAAGVPLSDHVVYDRGVNVKPARGHKMVAQVVGPYFDRAWDHFSSHAQTPSDKPTGFAAAVLGESTAYIAFPVFRSLANHGNYPYRLLVQNLIDALLPKPLVRVKGPTSLEVSVMRQKSSTIIHLLQYCPERRTKDLDIVEDIVPLYDVPVSLAMPKSPKRVYTAPDEAAVDFKYENGRVELVVPEVNGHAMVVFE